MRPRFFRSTRPLRALLTCVGGGLLALLAAACSEEAGPGEGCRGASDCTLGEICLEGYCVLPGAVDQPRNIGTGSSGQGGSIRDPEELDAGSDVAADASDAGTADAMLDGGGLADAATGGATSCSQLRFSQDPITVEFAPGSAIAQVQVTFTNHGGSPVFVSDVNVPVTRGFRIQSPSVANRTRTLEPGRRMSIVLVADPAIAQATFLDVTTNVCTKSAQLLVASR